MNSLKSLQENLDKTWRSFTGRGNAVAMVRDIREGIDTELRLILERSLFYFDRLKNKQQMGSEREQEWAEARRLEMAMEYRFRGQIHSAVEYFTILSSVAH